MKNPNGPATKQVKKKAGGNSGGTGRRKRQWGPYPEPHSPWNR